MCVWWGKDILKELEDSRLYFYFYCRNVLISNIVYRGILKLENNINNCDYRKFYLDFGIL